MSNIITVNSYHDGSTEQYSAAAGNDAFRLRNLDGNLARVHVNRVLLREYEGYVAFDIPAGLVRTLLDVQFGGVKVKAAPVKAVKAAKPKAKPKKAAKKQLKKKK